LFIEAEFLEEGIVSHVGGVFCGEEFVSVKDGIGSGVKAEGLGFPVHFTSPGGEADLGLRQTDSGGRDHPEEFERLDGCLLFHGGAGHGHQAVNGTTFRGGVETGQHLQHFEAVFHTFTHAQDAPATNIHSGVLNVFNGIESILKRVGGDDLVVKVGTGVDVVVIGSDACFFEFFSGLFGQGAKGDTDFHSEFGHLADGFLDRFELSRAFPDAAPGSAHAEAGGAVGMGLLGVGENFLSGHEFFPFQSGVVTGALGAVPAVFAASPGFNAEEGAELDFIVFPVTPGDFPRLINEGEQWQMIDGLEIG